VIADVADIVTGAGGGLAPVTSTRMGCLLDCLERSWRVLGVEDAAGAGTDGEES